jgi:hypothetical protein
MIEQLKPLVGTWEVETSLGAARASTTFEWTLGGAFLLQRAQVDLPEAPDALCVIAPDEQTGAFRQHYFDSRGVVRLYAMTFDGRTWTLRREAPDFTPLSFAQRFSAEVTADRMAGAWETRSDGAWEKDFDMVYTRVA